MVWFIKLSSCCDHEITRILFAEVGFISVHLEPEAKQLWFKNVVYMHIRHRQQLLIWNQFSQCLFHTYTFQGLCWSQLCFYLYVKYNKIIVSQGKKLKSPVYVCQKQPLFLHRASCHRVGAFVAALTCASLLIFTTESPPSLLGPVPCRGVSTSIQNLNLDQETKPSERENGSGGQGRMVGF